jgi:hypothetical protein
VRGTKNSIDNLLNNTQYLVVEAKPTVFVGYGFLFWVHLVLSREKFFTEEIHASKEKSG